ncbi:MAG TPA: hypothetical protein VGL61_13620 [Kofleriaceae bacterium]|jgi:hypothetical protein
MTRAATSIFSQVPSASSRLGCGRRRLELVAEHEPIWTPPRGAAPAPEPPSTTAHDAALLAILDAPLSARETIAQGFARKEVELRAAVAGLCLADARALLRRFTVAVRGDVLVERFARVAGERRARFVAFLADAPRRAALSAAKGGAR